jgi:hypothetical protein
MSEPHSDGLSSAGSSGSGSTGSGSTGSRAGKPASDPVADLQRWLMKAGARSMANQVADNVRRTLGQSKRDSGDIWDVATTEAPLDEPPECQWCPVCQAARRLRDSGPGLGSKLADAGGVLASVVGEAFSAVDKAMKTPAPATGRAQQPARSPGPAAPASPAAPTPAPPTPAPPTPAPPTPAPPTPAPSAATTAPPAATATPPTTAPATPAATPDDTNTAGTDKDAAGPEHAE